MGGQSNFTCGTRMVIWVGGDDYRVVCATCGKGGTVSYTLKAAQQACIRYSAKPCHACGAS